MLNKPIKPRKSKTQTIPIPGQVGVRIIVSEDKAQLELRRELGLQRKFFSRLINVSERTIAEVEAKHKKVEKLERNYTEVKRLCDALGEVVEVACLGDWLNSPNEAFEGQKPIEVIEHGEIDRLWEMYYRLRSGMPG